MIQYDELSIEAVRGDSHSWKECDCVVLLSYDLVVEMDSLAYLAIVMRMEAERCEEVNRLVPLNVVGSVPSAYQQNVVALEIRNPDTHLLEIEYAGNNLLQHPSNVVDDDGT